ncbi:MAG: L-histidine N(alpha)-methyltransferase [bacterium]
MAVFKNTQISDEYRVSSTTVLNWIENSLLKKNNLHITLVGKKYKIVDDPHNRSELEKLTEQAKIYKNKIDQKKVEITEDIFKLFTKDQLIELINNLKLNKRIPLKFSYLGKGSLEWENFTKESSKSGGYQADIKTPELLNKIFPVLLDRVSKFSKVNIFDLGTGNSNSMVEITKNFKNSRKLNKFIGLDISNEMLFISEKNIEDKVPGIVYEKCLKDIEKSDFASELFLSKSTNTVNLVFFIGNTIGNMENIDRTLQNLRYSLDKDDLLIISNKIDTIEKRSQFEPLSEKNPHSWLVKEFGIDLDLCTLETEFNEKNSSRMGYFKMDKDYIIDFSKAGIHEKVELFKNEKIVFWYHKMSSREEIINELNLAGLELLDLTTTTDLSHLLVVCKTRNEKI